MNTCKLDERQLLIRGTIFKHSLLTMGSLVLLGMFLMDMGTIPSSAYFSVGLLILVITLTVCSIEMIIHDVYPISDSRQSAVASLLGLGGIGLIVMSLIHFISGSERIISGTFLTKQGAMFITGILYFSIFIAFVIRYFYNKHHENDE